MSNVYSYFCCCVCPSKRSVYNSTLSIQTNVEFAKRKIGGLVFSKIWILNKNKIKSAQRTSNSYHSFEIWWSKILPVHSKRTKSISSSRLLVIFGCEFNFIHKRIVCLNFFNVNTDWVQRRHSAIWRKKFWNIYQKCD